MSDRLFEQSFIDHSRIFFPEKHKLYNLTKREIYILTTTTIKIKTCKYIKFTIVFYKFSYFEIDA